MSIMSVLVLSTFLLAAALIPQAGLKWPLWHRTVWAIAIFTALTFLLVQSVGSPFRPLFEDESPSQRFWVQLIVAGWWLMGARSAIGIARFLITLKHRSRETQIVSDLLAGVIYVATVLAITDFVFAIPIGGILATSGIIAIVLGLALQSTLADVFSGIAVGIERPYNVGDLISVEGGIEGRVMQMTWRSTQIATNNDNVAIVPNSIIAKARLVNHSLPTTIRRDMVEIRLSATTPPDHCLLTLTAAARSINLLLTAPAPEVTCINLHGDGNIYKVSFSVASSEHLAAARSELLTEMHRHLRCGGIPLAVAGIPNLPPVSIPTAAELLEQSDLFGVIESSQRDLLARHFRPIWRQAGEMLIQEGGAPDALYIVASGAAEITTRGPEGLQILHRMKPGESIGAIALITATPYAATATAITLLKVYRLDKDSIAAAIQAEPDLAHGLEALAKRGQAAMIRDAASREDQKQIHPETFLSKLRIFVQLLVTK